MKIFRNYTYTWWQMGMFKIALVSLGIFAGVCWRESLAQYADDLLALSAIIIIYLAFVTFKKK